MITCISKVQHDGKHLDPHFLSSVQYVTIVFKSLNEGKCGLRSHKAGKRQEQLRASDSAPNPLIPGCFRELSSFLFEIPETTNGKRIGI